MDEDVFDHGESPASIGVGPIIVLRRPAHLELRQGRGANWLAAAGRSFFAKDFAKNFAKN
ncbi:hypothetical protein [Bradyrhizobium arachidis]|uniref:hypothetical protein n=1 Tax=Bradyrhizobium arachidis TaxID=858423 RepID=UPI0021623AD4|nr:hypothetical protein [Bradyrhizobium arachidis]UVO27296.1 hypothetical protein KUF59_33075 [Bradyrhizobium arachidis]